MSITTYLNFPGYTREAFDYYYQIFGGNAPKFITYGDLPPEGHPDGENMAPSLKPLIMHVEYVFYGGKLMGADAPEGFGEPFILGNNFSIAIEINDFQEIRRVFEILRKDAKAILMDLGPQFFSPLYGNLIDKYGVSWQFIGE